MDRTVSTSVELTPGGTTIGTSASYNLAGLLADSYDGDNNHTQYLYDSRNRPTVTNYASSATSVSATASVSYDANSNVVKRTDERGNAWTNTYSARDRLLTTSDPLSNSSSYSYTSDALVQSYTNANGNPTSYTYKYCCPRLQYQTDALSFSKSYSYDPVGNVTGGTDESLRVVSYGFDGLYRQLTMTLDPGGSGHLSLTNSTAYSPPPAAGTIGTSTTATNAAGQVIVSSFDGMGRIISTSGNTAPVTYTYDTVVANGSLAGLVVSTITTGSGSTVLTTSAYADGAGRVVKTVDALQKSSSMSYDGNSNLVLSIDPDNRTVANSYDARNRLTQSVLSNTATTSYVFDPTSNLTQVTDPDSKVTNCTAYDAANRRTGTTYALRDFQRDDLEHELRRLLGQLQALPALKRRLIAYSLRAGSVALSRWYGGSAPLARQPMKLLHIFHPNRLLLSASGGIYNMNVSRGTAGGIGSWYDGANRLIQETQSFRGLTEDCMSWSVQRPTRLVMPDNLSGRRDDHRPQLQRPSAALPNSCRFFNAGHVCLRPGRSTEEHGLRQQRRNHQLDIGCRQPRDGACRDRQRRNLAILDLWLYRRGRPAFAKRPQLRHDGRGVPV